MASVTDGSSSWSVSRETVEMPNNDKEKNNSDHCPLEPMSVGLRRSDMTDRISGKFLHGGTGNIRVRVGDLQGRRRLFINTLASAQRTRVATGGQPLQQSVRIHREFAFNGLPDQCTLCGTDDRTEPTSWRTH
jgi:hypothetical protein